MKKAKLLVLTILLTVILTPTVSFAADNTSSPNDVISGQEYCDALSKKYAQYDIELEIKPIDGYVYTKELLNQELIKADEEGSALNQNNFVLNSSFRSALDLSSTTVSTLSAMPGTVTKSTVCFLAYSVACTWRVKVTSTMNVDFQHNTILSGGSPSLEVISGVNVEDYVALNSYSTSIYNGDGIIQYTVNAQFKVAASIGGVSGWKKINVTFYPTFTPFK